MDFEPTSFDGLNIVRHLRVVDSRGVFVKPWVADDMAGFGANAEAYFSASQAGVLRGLHYQSGEAVQAKYVTCLVGAIEDIAVDLRAESKTRGQTFRMRLEAMDGCGVIIPAGFAHGIFAHEPAVIVNFCDRSYAPGQEGGIHWRSVPELIELPVEILSDKDATLPSLEEVLQ